jgi:DNA-binding response OmpR family regulator
MPTPLDRNYSLLLVDADPTIGVSVTSALADHGHQVTVCRDGDAAMKLMDEKSFDLAIVDLHVADIDGFHFLSICSEDDKLIDMPVIVLSESDADEDYERAFALGAVGYLTKPLKLPLLAHNVWQVLRNRARDEELRWLKARLGFEAQGRVALSY